MLPLHVPGWTMAKSIEADAASIAAIAAVPTILDVLCRTTGMGFAAIARVTEDRWIACGVHDTTAFGLAPGGELKVETTLCREVRDRGEAIIINNTAEDPIYCRHPTPAMYGFQSYISVPILLADGSFFGTLCALDPVPARLDTPEVIGMFRLFAELIAFHIDAISKIDAAQARLEAEQETALLREQFIAVLAHDLRNPLAAIDAGVRLLSRMELNQKASVLIDQMHRSSSFMADLINNVLDFARGRLGGGLTLDLSMDDNLAEALDHVLAETRLIWPDRPIESRLDLAEPVFCDSARMAQLFANLLGNAIRHGAPGTPIRVGASVACGMFQLSVANAGDPISPAAMQRLFQPFFRGEIRPNQQGLGLGLFIVAEIARAHGGTIAVASTEAETRFTLTMPTGGPN